MLSSLNKDIIMIIIIHMYTLLYASPVPFFCLFVCFEALRTSQQFFSHVGTEPIIPGCYMYQYFRGVNVSCSRIQHGDRGDRSPVSGIGEQCRPRSATVG